MLYFYELERIANLGGDHSIQQSIVRVDGLLGRIQRFEGISFTRGGPNVTNVQIYLVDVPPGQEELIRRSCVFAGKESIGHKPHGAQHVLRSVRGENLRPILLRRARPDGLPERLNRSGALDYSDPVLLQDVIPLLGRGEGHGLGKVRPPRLDPGCRRPEFEVVILPEEDVAVVEAARRARLGIAHPDADLPLYQGSSRGEGLVRRCRGSDDRHQGGEGPRSPGKAAEHLTTFHRTAASDLIPLRGEGSRRPEAKEREEEEEEEGAHLVDRSDGLPRKEGGGGRHVCRTRGDMDRRRELTSRLSPGGDGTRNGEGGRNPAVRRDMNPNRFRAPEIRLGQERTIPTL